MNPRAWNALPGQFKGHFIGDRRFPQPAPKTLGRPVKVARPSVINNRSPRGR